MSRSVISLRPFLGLVFSVLVLGGCNAPDAGPVAEEAAAVPAEEGAAPMPDATAAGTEQAVDPEADVANAPMDAMTGQLVQLGAGLHALAEACSSAGAVDLGEARAASREALAVRAPTMSGADMDAAFDAAYSEAKQKLDALSATELSSSCAELDAMAEAGEAMSR